MVCLGAFATTCDQMTKKRKRKSFSNPSWDGSHIIKSSIYDYLGRYLASGENRETTRIFSVDTNTHTYTHIASSWQTVMNKAAVSREKKISFSF